MTLAEATSWVVPRRLVSATDQVVREAGSAGHELFALWSGVLVHSAFEVRHLHVPDQIMYRSEEGHGVRVEGPALHRLNVWLFEHDQALGVQLHSHPDEAYHSPTDDAFPIVTAVGSLSIVLAQFGRGGILASDTASYRLATSGFQPCDKHVASILTVV